MVKTWSTASRGETTCEKCGRVYEVKVTRFPMRDKDSFECACGNQIDSWNDTHVPIYTLISGPTKDDLAR